MTIAEGSTFTLAVSCPEGKCNGTIMVGVTVDHLKEKADEEELDGEGYTIATHTVYVGSCDRNGCTAECRVSFAPVVSVWRKPSSVSLLSLFLTKN